MPCHTRLPLNRARSFIPAKVLLATCLGILSLPAIAPADVVDCMLDGTRIINGVPQRTKTGPQTDDQTDERYADEYRAYIERRYTYYNVPRALMLAEGPSGLAESAAKERPDTQFTSTDIEYSGESRVSPNLVRMHMDNSKNFPFEDNEFQFIGMEKGICSHASAPAGHTCGGVPLSTDGAGAFLTEVARVLDKSHPYSVAYIGSSLDNQGGRPFWMQAAAVAIQKFPQVLIEPILTGSSRHFLGLKFSIRPDPLMRNHPNP